MIDVSAVGASVGPVREAWDPRDVMLYALGVGAGSTDPMAELDLTTESSVGHPLQVLPTYAVVVAARRREIYAALGEVDWTKVVHARQSVVVHEPLSPAGCADVSTTISAIYDKSSAALVELSTTGDDPETGRRLFSTVSTLFVRDAGGWGGDRGPSAAQPRPDATPDARVVMSTRPDQALLYRLSGDLNPLHSDPSFARRAGFAAPILHGLCTYGYTARALVHELCGSVVTRFGSMDARFSRPVMPGSDLGVDIWRDGPGRALFQVRDGDGNVVLDAGVCEFDEA